MDPTKLTLGAEAGIDYRLPTASSVNANPTDAFAINIVGSETNNLPTETNIFLINLLQSEIINLATENTTLSLQGFNDTNIIPIDLLLQLAISGFNDTNVVPTEILSLNITGLGDINNLPTELLNLNIQGLADTNSTPTEVRTVVVRSWATGCTSNDANLANPGNANGANDGSFCLVKTNNALGDLTNPVTLDTGNINFPGGTVTSSKIRVWFKMPGFTGVSADTLFISATSSGGFSQHIWDGPTIGTVNPATVDHSTGDFTFDTSSLTNTQLTNLVLHASYTSAVVAAPQTTLNIDAWSMDATEAI